MSRYYFHLVQRILDDEGFEMAEGDIEDLDFIIEEIRSEEPELFDVEGGWAMEDANEEGHTIARFPLSSPSLAEAMKVFIAAKIKARKQ